MIEAEVLAPDRIFVANERSWVAEYIEKLAAEHKECKLRCQAIEKEIGDLLDYQGTETV